MKVKILDYCDKFSVDYKRIPPGSFIVPGFGTRPERKLVGRSISLDKFSFFWLFIGASEHHFWVWQIAIHSDTDDGWLNIWGADAPVLTNIYVNDDKVSRWFDTAVIIDFE